MKRMRLILILTLLAATGFTAKAQFAGGNGTKSDPYRIANAQQLNDVRQFLNKHFVLISDIDLKDFDSDGNPSNGKYWTPIGAYGSSYFSGSLDGAGHKITNLKTDPSAQCSGLFGAAGSSDSDTIFRRLTIASGTITSTRNDNKPAYAGALVAYFTYGSIYNCKNQAQVTSYTYDIPTLSPSPIAYSGGIVGYNSRGNIMTCSNSGAIKATSNAASAYCGGIVGRSDESNKLITQCTNSGLINANAYSSVYAGGISGAASGSLFVISLCNNSGEIKAVSTGNSVCIGGITGQFGGSEIVRCNNFGNINIIKGNSIYAGGIVGVGNGQITACNNMGNIEFSASEDDFSSAISAGGIAGESGGIIEQCYNKATIMIKSNKYAYGGGIVGRRGQCYHCHNMGNIYVNGIKESYAGGILGTEGNRVFQCQNNGMIDAVSTEKAYSGGITGGSGEDIEQCCNQGIVNSISSKSAYAGGISGATSSAVSTKITQCYNINKVSAKGEFVSVGGITGHFPGGTIAQCYNMVDIKIDHDVVDRSYVGGISGYHYGLLFQCYNTGNIDVTALQEAFVGGISGHNNISNIKNCVSISHGIRAVAPKTKVGRIAGSSSGTISKCYALSSMLVNGEMITNDDPNSINGKDEILSNLQKRSTYEAISTEIGIQWDFTPITGGWEIWENNSFPFFQWQSAPVKITAWSLLSISGSHRMGQDINNDDIEMDSICFYNQDWEFLGNLVKPDLSENWNFTFDPPLAANDTIQVVAYENGKKMSYPAKSPTGFLTTYNIAASADANGSITPEGNVTVVAETNQTFIIKPKQGYVISSVLIDGINNLDAIQSGRYVFENVTANHDIVATFAPETGIDEGEIVALMVYPNPTAGKISVASDALQVTGVEVFDLLGRRVLEQKAEGGKQQEIDIAHLPAGVYFVQVKTEQGVITKKVVKQ